MHADTTGGCIISIPGIASVAPLTNLDRFSFVTALNTSSGEIDSRSTALPANLRETPRWFWPTIVTLVIVHAIAAWYLRIPGIVTGGDDAVYIQLAREIQHFSYRDQFLNGAPGHVKFPPGYPAFLAGISAIAGESVDAFLLGGIAATIGGLLLLADAARRRLSPTAALLIIIATFINPRLIQYSGSVMSEALFFLCVAAAVWALSQDRARRSHVLIAGAAAIAAALTRSAGVAVVLAVVVTLLLARRTRSAIMVAMAAFVLNGAWFLWTTHAPEPIDGSQGENYISDTFIPNNSASPSLPRLIPRRIFNNTRKYATRTVPSLLPLPHIEGTLLDNLFLVGVTGMCFMVGAWRLRRSWTIVPAVVATYVSVLLVWPWVVIRFMSPMIPFIVVLVIAGALAIVRPFRSPYRILLPAGIAATVSLTAVASLGGAVRDVAACDRTQPLVSSNCIRPEQRDFLRLSQWVNESVSEHAVFLVHKEGTFGYLTGRRTIPLMRVLRSDATRMSDLLGELGVTHIALTTLSHASISLAEQLLPSCRSLELERELSPTMLVFRVRSDRASDDIASPASCDAIERYRRIMIERGASSK